MKNKLVIDLGPLVAFILSIIFAAYGKITLYELVLFALLTLRFKVTF